MADPEILGQNPWADIARKDLANFMPPDISFDPSTGLLSAGDLIGTPDQVIKGLFPRRANPDRKYDFAFAVGFLVGVESVVETKNTQTPKMKVENTRRSRTFNVRPNPPIIPAPALRVAKATKRGRRG